MLLVPDAAVSWSALVHYLSGQVASLDDRMLMVESSEELTVEPAAL
ncbi:MAG: hypothetical protein LBG11_05705 [Bifidobacteriaceae bacterium]|jgi:hypothetical protein|nr:hypothetical protein [Bifidobacteriaceae bacterium]